MKNLTRFETIAGALVVTFFLILMLWIVAQISAISTETRESADALEIMVATAQQSRDSARANAHATGTALGTELDGLRATATARASVPTSAPAPTPAPIWPISIEECDSYEPPDRAEHIIESEIEFFILSYNHSLSAIALTSCAENYGEPYFEWLQYYILQGLAQLDWGITMMDPEWHRYPLEPLPTPETDQG